MNKNQQIYFSDKQVAARYGVHRTRIWSWVKDYGFPRPIRLSPGCSRWAKEDIELYEESKKTAKTLQEV